MGNLDAWYRLYNPKDGLEAATRHMSQLEQVEMPELDKPGANAPIAIMVFILSLSES